MKKILLILLTTLGVTLSNAQSGPQPRQTLYIPSLTIIPNGCGSGTSTLEVIAAGGQPNAQGAYTYTLKAGTSTTGISQTAPTATFTDVLANNFYAVTVTDSANVSFTETLIFSNSQTKSVNISSALALGDGTGCITLSAENPPGIVQFQLYTDTLEFLNVFEPPFTHTFSALPRSSVTALIATFGDCGAAYGFFQVTFPFPQGKANAVRTYLVNKFCGNCGQGSAS